jgi:hypothetical protein
VGLAIFREGNEVEPGKGKGERETRIARICTNLQSVKPALLTTDDTD